MPVNGSTTANDKTFPLHDGRMLGYAEYGSAQGRALFYFHGHPGSRFEAQFLAAQAEQTGIRLIGVDRPGMGLSTFKPGRRLLDWPDDVLELANYLDIERFAVVGFSGGAPYSLACAYKAPHRLTACGLVSSVGHMGRLVSFLAQWLPWLLLPVTRRFFQDQQRAENMLLHVSRNWVEPDQRSLLMPGVKEILAASLVEGLCQGARGAAYDGMLLGSAWGFLLQDIRFPAIYLWHGETDKEVPVGVAHALAKRLGQAKALYWPNEGHISVIVNHGGEFMATLMAAGEGVQQSAASQ